MGARECQAHRGVRPAIAAFCEEYRGTAHGTFPAPHTGPLQGRTGRKGKRWTGKGLTNVVFSAGFSRASSAVPKSISTCRWCSQGKHPVGKRTHKYADSASPGASGPKGGDEGAGGGGGFLFHVKGLQMNHNRLQQPPAPQEVAGSAQNGTFPTFSCNGCSRAQKLWLQPFSGGAGELGRKAAALAGVCNSPRYCKNGRNCDLFTCLSLRPMVLRSVSSLICFAPAVIFCLSGGTPVRAKSCMGAQARSAAALALASRLIGAAHVRRPGLKRRMTCVCSTSAGSSSMMSTSYLFLSHLIFTDTLACHSAPTCQGTHGNSRSPGAPIASPRRRPDEVTAAPTIFLKWTGGSVCARSGKRKNRTMQA